MASRTIRDPLRFGLVLAALALATAAQGADVTAVQALQDQLASSSAALAAAVTANTPAGPSVPPDLPPPPTE